MTGQTPPGMTQDTPVTPARTSRLRLILSFVLMTALLPGVLPPAHAAAPVVADAVSDQTSPGKTDTLFALPASVASDDALNALEANISKVFHTRVASGTERSATVVAELIREAATDEKTATAMIGRLEPYETIYKNMLDVLGPAPAKDAPQEPVSLTRQRTRLIQAQHDLAERLTRARLYEIQAHQLVTALSQRNNAAQQARLLQRFSSPVSPSFWERLTAEIPADIGRIQIFFGEAGDTLAGAMHGGDLIIFLIACPVGTLLMLVPFFIRNPVRRFAGRLFPEPRVSQITAVLLCGVLCAVLAGGGAVLFWTGFSGTQDLEGTGLDRFATLAGSQIPLAAFVFGAGMMLLSPRHPEWRPVPLADQAARALVSCTAAFTALLLFRGVLRYVDTASGLGPCIIQLADCTFVAATAALLLLTPGRIMSADGADNTPVFRTVAGRTIRIIAFLLAVFCAGAALTGYVPLGYIVLSWICSMVVTALGLGLVFVLVNGLASTIFRSNGGIGQRLVHIGIPGRLVDQASVVLSGLFSVFLIFVAIAVARSGGDFDFSVIMGNIGQMIFGQQLGGMTLSFDIILKCLAIPVVGHYLIGLVKNWLKDRLFPTTSLDIGARTSILTIFTYATWIGIGMMILSTIGITVKSMTWVVSALSVGIGFGLQLIVQNFVSGIILLAERPVTIGDLVEIGGRTGDIRRISVRSTDIALSDGSTVIVPNSQFITSAVRNVTMGRPLGALSVSVGLPLGTNLTKAVDVMSKALATVDGLLKDPEPSVTVASIDSDTVTLTAAGKTASPRDVSAVSNSVRMALWTALDENGIVATVEPVQNVRIQAAPPPQPQTS